MRARIFFLLLFFILSAPSCKKDTIEQADKEPLACIAGPSETELSTATFTWCGENADEIEWRLNGGPVAGTGATFTATFTTKGSQTVSATGKNKSYSTETSLIVFYGSSSKVVCRITLLDPLQGDKKKVKAYLYNSKADWAVDAINHSHSRVIDSVNCRDTSGLGSVTHVALFKNRFATGSTKLIAVEYIDPLKPKFMESNWYALYKGGAGNVTIGNRDHEDDTCSTYLERFTKFILTTKWNLVQLDTGAGFETPSYCMNDDYMRFYADGSWKYFTGSDTCAVANAPSSGIFISIPFFGGPGFTPIQALSGPLRSRGPYSWEINSSFESRIPLAPKGYLVFVPDW